MKKITLILILMLFVSLLAYASPAGKYIGYTGYLEEYDSVSEEYSPVTGNRDFRFTIAFWNTDLDPDAYDPVWQEEHKEATSSAIYVDTGEFSVLVGSETAFDDSNWTLDFSSELEYWLKVEVKDPSVQDYEEHEGWKLILSVPYSFDADGVEGELPTIIQVLTQQEEDDMTPVTGQMWLVE
jgi:hypothetical protein